MKKFLGNKVAIALFTLPALIVYSIMVMYPLMQTFFRSMYQWDGLTAGTFIWFDNYKELLEDSVFHTSVYNGLIFAAIITITQICIGSILAFAVAHGKYKGRKILRVSYFIPVVLSITVVCQLWLSIYNSEYGLLNKVFGILGLDYQQDWLSNGKSAIIAIAFVNAWQYMGYHFALLLAGVRSVPEQYMEAARIDGANKFQAITKVMIPMMSETYKFCLIFAVTGGLNAFANMYIMTSGGPGTSTYTLTYLMYRSAFRVGEFGYGSAAAAVLVIECLLATLIINCLVARERISY